jgi:hypothetical protein
MALCFFMRVDSGMLAFLTIPRLSQKTLAGPSIGTPNMRSLYLRVTMSSLQIRTVFKFLLLSPCRSSAHTTSATNSLPKVAASTVFYRLENQTIIGAFCTNRKMPLCEHLLVMTLPAWLASTKADEFFSDVAVKFWRCLRPNRSPVARHSLP